MKILCYKVVDIKQFVPAHNTHSSLSNRHTRHTRHRHTPKKGLKVMKKLSRVCRLCSKLASKLVLKNPIVSKFINYLSSSIDNHANTNQDIAQPNQFHTNYRSYTRRWWVLFIFACSCISQSLIWNTFAPIKSAVMNNETDLDIHNSDIYAIVSK